MKTIPCKMHAFYQNADSFKLLYSGFVSCNIQALCKKISVYLSDCRVVFFFFPRNENPD